MELYSFIYFHRLESITKIIEPFAGHKDLIKFIQDKEKYVIQCYDIDPQEQGIIKRDTIKDPPDYENSFVITNPPYFARNKCEDKTLFDKYNVNDLYKCFMSEIIDNKCLGGILIIPINFWSSIRKNDIKLRKNFLKKYNVPILNIFEESVFDDTTCTVCSMQFEAKINDTTPINATFYPSKEKIKIKLTKDNNYIVGGEIYNVGDKSDYNVSRLTKKNKDKKNTNILVKCIDDNSKNMICLKYVKDDEIYIDETPNMSSRTYATLIIEPAIAIEKQKQVIDDFNNFINKYRKKYHSMFLTNYRESNDIARKRISFDLVYNIVRHILDKQDEN